MDTKQRILNFLYVQVQRNNITHIRKNMLEEFEAFFLQLMAEHEAIKAAERMEAQTKEEDKGYVVAEDQKPVAKVARSK